MNYNPKIHHRRSIRLKGYDYSQEGLYFITICVKDMECLFGKIENDEMILNAAGKNANECWLKIPEHFPNTILHEHIVMPNHVHGIIEIVVPKNFSPIDTNNHSPVDANNVSPDNITANNVGAKKFSPIDTNNHSPVDTNNHSPIDAKKFSPPVRANDYSPQQFQSPSKTIGSIIRGYKIGVSKWFRDNPVGAKNFSPVNNNAPDVGAKKFSPLQTNDVDNRAKNFSPLPSKWQRDFYEHIIRDKQSYQRISEYIINNPKNWKGDKFYKR
jgi:REP element-mobilizing transposase RayT